MPPFLNGVPAARVPSLWKLWLVVDFYLWKGSVITGYIFLFCVFFLDKVSLCNPSCPGTLSVNQAGLELKRDRFCHLVLPPECWD